MLTDAFPWPWRSRLPALPLGEQTSHPRGVDSPAEDQSFRGRSGHVCGRSSPGCCRSDPRDCCTAAPSRCDSGRAPDHRLQRSRVGPAAGVSRGSRLARPESVGNRSKRQSGIRWGRVLEVLYVARVPSRRRRRLPQVLQAHEGGLRRETYRIAVVGDVGPDRADTPVGVGQEPRESLSEGERDSRRLSLRRPGAA